MNGKTEESEGRQGLFCGSGNELWRGREGKLAPMAGAERREGSGEKVTAVVVVLRVEVGEEKRGKKEFLVQWVE